MLLLILFCLAIDSTTSTNASTAELTSLSTTPESTTTLRDTIIQLPSNDCSYTNNFAVINDDLYFNYTLSEQWNTSSIYNINFCSEQTFFYLSIVHNNSTQQIWNQAITCDCFNFNFIRNTSNESYYDDDNDISMEPNTPFSFVFGVSGDTPSALNISISCEAFPSTPTTCLTTRMSHTSTSKSNTLSDGEIIGITIGAVIAIIIIATVITFICL